MASFPDDWPDWPVKLLPIVASYVSSAAAELLEIRRIYEPLLGQSRYREVIEGIYNLLAAEEIRYDSGGLDLIGAKEGTQPVRSPYKLLRTQNKKGNCLDLSLLFCGVCLGVSLRPVVIIFNTHALAAVSLTPVSKEYDPRGPPPPDVEFSDKILEDPQPLLDAVSAGKYIVIECTGFAMGRNSSSSEARDVRHGKILSFEDAVARGHQLLQEAVNTGTYRGAIDISVAQGPWAIPAYRLPAYPSLPRLPEFPSDIEDSFFKRQNEISRIGGILSNGKHVAICPEHGLGLGGLGKTTLAVHVAHHCADAYRGGLLLQRLSDESGNPMNAHEAMRNITRRLGYSSDSIPPDQIGDFYQQRLSERGRFLLVLDNATDIGQVRPLLPDSHDCQVIVTSRNKIVLPQQGMEIYELPLLTLEQGKRFLRLMLSNQREIAEPLVEQVANLCAGLPLALCIAGASLRVYLDLPVEDYIGQLQQSALSVLCDQLRSVEATLGVSAKLLVDRNRDWAEQWQMLSVFAETFDRHAAAAVWQLSQPAASDTLSRLTERSLLIWDAGSRRYRLHELMRPIAKEVFKYSNVQSSAEASNERLNKAAAQHAKHYGEKLYSMEVALVHEGTLAFKTLASLEEDLPNIRIGYAWARSHSTQTKEAVKTLVSYCVPRLTLQKLLGTAERQSWYESGLTAVRSPLGQHPHPEIMLLNNLAAAHCEVNDMDRARSCAEAAVQVARALAGQLQDMNFLAEPLYMLGYVQYRQEDMDNARKNLQESLRLSLAAGDDVLYRHHLNLIRKLTVQGGNTKDANRLFRTMLCELRKSGAIPTLEAELLLERAQSAVRRKLVCRGRVYAKHAAQLAKQTHESEVEFLAEMLLAESYLAEDADKSTGHCNRATEIVERSRVRGKNWINEPWVSGLRQYYADMQMQSVR